MTVKFEIVKNGFETFAKKNLSTSRRNQIARAIANYFERSTVEKIRKGNIKGKKTLSPARLATKRAGRGTILNDTGRLANSINSSWDISTVKVGTNLVYAGIHQNGGIIKPKNAKNLCIPATKQTSLMSATKGVRATLDFFKKKGKVWFAGKVILFQVGKNKPEVLFYLKKSVEMPKRQFLYISEQDKRAITNIYKNALG